MPPVGSAKAASPPSAATLRKYGMTPADWWALFRSQGRKCVVCRRVPASGRMVIDHEHVRGWKKLPPGERRRHVRGVLCRFCNSHCVGRFMTLPKAVNVAEYLRRHTSRPFFSPENGPGGKGAK